MVNIRKLIRNVNEQGSFFNTLLKYSLFSIYNNNSEEIKTSLHKKKTFVIGDDVLSYMKEKGIITNDDLVEKTVDMPFREEIKEDEYSDDEVEGEWEYEDEDEDEDEEEEEGEEEEEDGDEEEGEEDELDDGDADDDRDKEYEEMMDLINLLS
jgi:cobalamin biosynthesis protein CobT